MISDIITYIIFSTFVLVNLVAGIFIITWGISIGIIFPVSFVGLIFIINGIVGLYNELTKE